MGWAKEKKAASRAALLRSRIELAQQEAQNFIEDHAAAIAKECPGIPFGVIVGQVRKGLCHCAAARAIMEQEGD